MFSLRALLLATLTLATCAAQAQWMWLDGNGKKVFSDRAPSADVPERNILKRPAGYPPVAASVSAAPASASASSPKPGGKDAELEKKKAQADAAEAEKKKADEQKLAALKAGNCDRAKRELATLQSGMRIAQVNAKGEREYLSDSGRQAEAQRVQEVMASDCAP